MKENHLKCESRKLHNQKQLEVVFYTELTGNHMCQSLIFNKVTAFFLVTSAKFQEHLFPEHLRATASTYFRFRCTERALELFHRSIQKQPSRGVLKKRFSENMQQIYRRTPMPKCNFNKVALQLY